ncbi:MAG: hypothetical protein DRP85_03830 [Candidatus Makaraimicrobium thalassicum]|nr:MAG: hypothetical protein DRP85_03830 [Candidatus Omnitrophota bacterium]
MVKRAKFSILVIIITGLISLPQDSFAQNGKVKPPVCFNNRDAGRKDISENAKEKIKNIKLNRDLSLERTSLNLPSAISEEKSSDKKFTTWQIKTTRIKQVIRQLTGRPGIRQLIRQLKIGQLTRQIIRRVGIRRQEKRQEQAIETAEQVPAKLLNCGIQDIAIVKSFFCNAGLNASVTNFMAQPGGLKNEVSLRTKIFDPEILNDESAYATGQDRKVSQDRNARSPSEKAKEGKSRNPGIETEEIHVTGIKHIGYGRRHSGSRSRGRGPSFYGRRIEGNRIELIMDSGYKMVWDVTVTKYPGRTEGEMTGQLVSITTPEGKKIEYEHSLARRIVDEEGEMTGSFTYEFAGGALWEEEDLVGTTMIYHDGRGRAIRYSGLADPIVGTGSGGIKGNIGIKEFNSMQKVREQIVTQGQQRYYGLKDDAYSRSVNMMIGGK